MNGSHVKDAAKRLGMVRLLQAYAAIMDCM